ncbi:hypothetical protein DPSP01_014343 [Paraphaeosphaeria sporulosa]
MAVLNWDELRFAHYSPGQSVAISSGVLLFIYIIANAIYRLYFHPLARFPGPLFARLTPIPATWSLLRGRIPFYVKACHDKYGPIVRIAPNELCFDNESAWKDIYGSRGLGHKNFQKDPIHVGSIAAVHGASTITMAGDDDHARQRRALSHAFSTKALLEQESIVMKYIETFSQKMQEFARGDGIVDVTDWFAYTTFDVIGELALGEPFGCLHNEDFRFWVPLISESIKAGAIEQATRRVSQTGSPLQRFLQWCIPSHVAESRKQHLDYSKEKILKRMETKTDNRDFLHYVMKQQDKGDLNLGEVIVNGALFIIAGTETTAGFLTGLFNLITRAENKHILDKLTAEIRSSFQSEDELHFEDLAKLPYMTAVIEEGLRMFPSAPIGFVRTVPEGGDTVSGEFIPGGTTVSVCMWAATKSERNFQDPYVFRPERWLDRENNQTDKLSASNPFSLGPRGCIGRNLSYMEMRLIIAKLLWHHDVEMYGSNEVWNPKNEYENMFVYNNWLKPGLKLKLTPRRI